MSPTQPVPDLDLADMRARLLTLREEIEALAGASGNEPPVETSFLGPEQGAVKPTRLLTSAMPFPLVVDPLADGRN